MNVETSIDRPLKAAHRDAIDDVNRWRGHCMDCFARIDESVAETLRALAKSERQGTSVKTPLLFGLRIEALRKAISPSGSFHTEGREVSKALTKLESFLAQRNTLVHGVGTIWINASGDWLWRYRYVANSKNCPAEEGAIDRESAESMEIALASGTRSFCDRLRNLAAKLA